MTTKARLGPLDCVRNPVIDWPELIVPVAVRMISYPPFAGMEADVAAALAPPSGAVFEIAKVTVPLAGPAPLIDPKVVPPLFTTIAHVPAVRARALTVGAVPVPAVFQHATVLLGMDSVAGLADVPKIPKTKVAMATAAMRVIAMRMTVASTGEMAFL